MLLKGKIWCYGNSEITEVQNREFWVKGMKATKMP